MALQLFTDGGCSNNQEKRNYGGWGYAVIDEQEEIVVEDFGGAIDTTNNKMELTACIKGLRELYSREEGRTIEVYTDSAYLCNCINQKWYQNWMRNGWMNSKKQPVANKDLWEALIEVYYALQEAFPFGREIKFLKVKGHSGVPMNEYVDGLAGKGIQSAQLIERKL